MSLVSLATEFAHREAAPPAEARSRMMDRPAKAAAAGTSALDSLVKYIPTEVITLYVAGVSVTSPAKDAKDAAAAGLAAYFTGPGLYWGSVVATPIVLFLVYWRKIAVANRRLPGYGKWPWWRMAAATIAFMVWAVAIPSNPYHGWVGPTFAGFGALVVSTALSLVEPLAERRKG